MRDVFDNSASDYWMQALTEVNAGRLGGPNR